MKSSARIFLLLTFLVSSLCSFSQKAKPVYHPCFLMDSVDAKLSFIQLNASRIFTDTVECKQNVLDNIAALYIKTKDKKYLNALSAIRQNPNAKVDELYTDIINHFAENDFAGFINEIYLAKGKYFALEKELITTMNMIVGTKPLKQKYLGLLNVEIGKAKDKKDSYKTYFLEKLKTKIEDEKY
jgi:hypothetical protein